jgi:hypothetical protein
VLEQLAALMADASVAHHPTVLLMAAHIYALEGNFPEALKACNAVQNLELCAPRARRPGACVAAAHAGARARRSAAAQRAPRRTQP